MLRDIAVTALEAAIIGIWVGLMGSAIYMLMTGLVQ